MHHSHEGGVGLSEVVPLSSCSPEGDLSYACIHVSVALPSCGRTFGRYFPHTVRFGVLSSGKLLGRVGSGVLMSGSLHVFLHGVIHETIPVLYGVFAR